MQTIRDFSFCRSSAVAAVAAAPNWKVTRTWRDPTDDR